MIVGVLGTFENYDFLFNLYLNEVTPLLYIGDGTGRSCLQQVLKLISLSIACVTLLYTGIPSSFFPAFLNGVFFFYYSYGVLPLVILEGFCYISTEVPSFPDT